MKILIWLLQFAIVVWLLWWSFFIFIQPIEKLSPTIVHCPDRDAQAGVLMALAIVWITTMLVLGFSILARFWQRRPGLWFINIVAVMISIASTSGYREVVNYYQHLEPHCIR